MKFSIITAVYNNQEHILDALNSVDSQQGVEVEHIVMDSCSIDGTTEKVKNYSSKKISHIIEKDKGIYDALNKGMRRARGEIIGILHSDDLFADNQVLKKVHELFLEGADVVYADLDYVQRDNPQVIFRRWKSGLFNELQLRLGWVAPHPAVFISKQVYLKIGDYDQKYNISGDYDYILRILMKNKYKVSYLPETISKMRLGGESNRSWKHTLRGSQQDREIAGKYFFAPSLTVLFKVLRKVPQLIKR